MKTVRRILRVLVLVTFGSACASVAAMASATVVQLWWGRNAHGPLPVTLICVGAVGGAMFGGWIAARADRLGWIKGSDEQ